MTNKINRIYLDLDGVIVDFVSAALELFDVDPDDPNVIQPGVWEIHEWLGIESGVFWDCIESCGAQFWADLESYSWADLVLELCAETAPVTIATSPSRDPSCVAGKIMWMQRRFGEHFRDFAIIPDKSLLAQPGAVLIDDSDKNCQEFRKAGGRAILFSQPWNSLHDYKYTAEYLKRALRVALTL